MTARIANCLASMALLLAAFPAQTHLARAQEPPAAEEVEQEKVEIVPESAKDAPPSETRDLPKVARLIVDQANQFREAEGREALSTNQRLTATAEEFARYMARNHRYGHSADGKTPAERAEAQGYDYCIVRENIAYQFSTRGFSAEKLAQRNSDGWEESPEHRENLLDPDVTEIGVGVAQSADTEYYFAVQLLGRPKSAAIRFELVNQSDTAVEYAVDGRSYELKTRQIRTHERCRPPKVVVDWPSELKRKPEMLRPKPGDRFVVERGPGGELRVVRGDREKGPQQQR